MIEFRSHAMSGRTAITVCFFMWGLGGLAMSVFALMGAPILTAIYVCLLWIGGVLFFGISALMSGVSYRTLDPAFPVYVVEKPRADGLNEIYRGVPFMRLTGGQVVAEFSDGKHTFRSWKKFTQAVPENG